MRLTIEAKTLAAAIKEARSVIPSVPDTAAAGAVLLSCSGGEITVSGAGPRGQISIRLKAGEGAEDGSTLIQPRPLESLLRALPKGEATLSADESGDVEIAGNGAAQGYRLRGTPGTRYAFPFDFGPSTECSPSDLARALAAVRRSSDSDDNAAHMRIGRSSITVETTDNYRLSRSEIKAEGESEGYAVLRHSDLESGARAGCGSLSLDASGSALRMSSENQTRIIRAIDRSFPATDGLVKKLPSQRAKLDASELSAAVKRLQSVTQGGPVLMSFAGGELLLSGGNPEVGSGAESIKALGGGGDAAILVRSEYILDVAESHTGVLHILFSDAKSAIRFEDGEGTVHVVMPLRQA